MSALADRLHRLPASPAAAQAALLLASASVLVLAARLLLLLLGEAQLPPTDPAAPVSVVDAGPRTPLADWHLFGQAEALAAAPSSETSLALVLRGTIAAADPRQGLAFIADGQGHDARYRVGDALPGGARLEEVHAGQIVLSREGRRETLSLRGAPRRSAPAAAAPASPDGGYLSGNLAMGAPDLETQRALRAPDLQVLAEQANVVPVLDNGRVIGVRVAVADPALLDRVGLQADDIVTSVNGIALDDPSLAPALQNQLRAGGLLTLTVRRGGQDLTLSLGL